MAGVYLHRKKDTEEIFYIGIWLKDKRRPFVKTGRTKWWNNIVEKHKLNVEILFDDIDEKQAKQIEEYLIAFYGRMDTTNWGKLINMTDGGDGISGYKHTNKYKKEQSKIASKNMTSEVKARIGREKSLDLFIYDTTFKLKDVFKSLISAVNENDFSESGIRTAIQNKLAYKGFVFSREELDEEEVITRFCNNVKNMPVICINTGKVYQSAKEASEKLLIRREYINKVCIDTQATTSGMKFKYLKDEQR